MERRERVVRHLVMCLGKCLAVDDQQARVAVGSDPLHVRRCAHHGSVARLGRVPRARRTRRIRELPGREVFHHHDDASDDVLAVEER